MKNKSIIILNLIALGLLGVLAYYGAESLPSTADVAPLSAMSVSPMDKAIQDERDAAVALARDGKYDESLTQLSKLHEHYPDVAGITSDYIAVLGWAGHDEESTKLYETGPADQPDYVLAAVGHSYRILNQPEKAMAAYKLGEQKYPDSVVFVEGEIRTLADEGKLDEAGARADEDLQAHGNRAEIVAAKADIVQAQIKVAHDNAVQLARDGKYDQSLALFRGNLLDAEHTTDPSIRRDYLAVLGWQGGHDAEVVAIYKTLKDEDQTDFTMLATAKAYRNQRHSDIALQIYRQGMKQYPQETQFQVGEIDCLLDARKYDEAEKKIKAYEAVHGVTAEFEAAKRGIARARFDAVRTKAAKLAREGHYDQALAILRKLGGEHTKNVGIIQDRIAILSWQGGHDQDVIDQYLALHNPNQPDYVLEAVGKAYRDLGKTQEAIEIYENGMRRYPKSEIFAVGTIRTLTEGGYVEKALAFADDNLKRYGNRLDVLLAAADAANQYDQNVALHYYQEAAAIAPHNPDVLRGLIRTSDRLGAPQVALKVIDENPGIVSDSEKRMIEGDDIAAKVRMGMLDQDKNPPSYAGTDSAIELIDRRTAEWAAEGPDAQVNITRARYDRIVALHNRSRMKEVVAEYESLKAQGATPPDFTLGAVGDAYLDLHEPEKARDIYLQILQTEPKNNLVRRQLFYAYVDLNDYKNAYRIADQMVADGTVWDRQKNEDVPMSDAQHRDVELTAGAARLYFGQVSEADKILLPVIAANPDSPAAHEALGNLDSAHDWPRRALEQYQTGVQLAGGENISNEVGEANMNLQLHNFQTATNEIDSLVERYPDNASVRRAKRDLDVYNMAEIDITAGYAFEPMTDGPTDPNGGEAWGIGAKVYSSPFWYNWRLFAGESFAHQKEPDNEGSIGVSRSTVGVEYRNGDLTANLAPTYNIYHDTDRVGVAGDATYNFNDNWALAGGAELFSTETPLRALNHGVTADMYSAHAVWKRDEETSVRFGGSMMPFSDENFRTEQDADFTQRLITQPEWRLDGLVSAGLDQNSKDENRSYYNPKADGIGLIGAQIVHTLYQRYSTLWQQTLRVMPGAYWQENYGTDATIRARYEQRVFFDQTFDAGAGVNFQRQSYDGAAENDVSLTLDVTDHF